MQITVFGATGPTGRLAVRHALANGHRVTVYARTPEKLDELHGLPGLSVIAGELDDSAGRSRSGREDREAVLDGQPGGDGDEVTQFVGAGRDAMFGDDACDVLLNGVDGPRRCTDNAAIQGS